MKMLLTLMLVVTISFCFKIQRREDSQGGYDAELSKVYVAYGILSYCPKKCIEAWNCQFSEKFPKLVNVTHVNNEITLAAAYIGYEPVSKTVVISWRGSSNAQNWIEDFTFQMEPFAGCKKCFIHAGFHADYHLNQKKINDKLDTLLKSYNVTKILITGHSLGAALASINAIYIAMQEKNVAIQVYNFGSPRFGNQNLAQFVLQKIPNHYRLVHNRDLVPHLPPQVEYRHVAHQIFYSKDMISYKICNDSGEDPICSNKFFPDYSTADHDFYFYDIGATKC